MKFIESRLRNWLVPIIVGVVILISIFIIGLPTIRQTSQLRNDVTQERERLALLTTKLSQLTALDESLLQSQLFEAEIALPSRKPVFETLSSLSLQASESGVLLGSFNFSPGEVATQSSQASPDTSASEKIDPGVLSRMPLSVSLTGSNDVIIRFLEILSQSAPLIEPIQVNLATGTTSQEFIEQEQELIDPGASATLTFDVLYSLPPENIGKLSDPLPVINPQQTATLQLIQSLNKYSQDFTFSNTNTGKTNPFTF